MNFDELKNQVAGWVSRDVDAFTKNAFDNLESAINNALLRAQRNVDFELAKARGYLPLTDGRADWTSDLLDEKDGSSVTPKKLIAFYLDENFAYHVRFRTSEELTRLGPTGGGQYVYQYGSTLYAKNLPNNQEGLYVEYYQKLAPLANSSDSNFLTEYCNDWIMLQAVFDLQAYQGNDGRMPVTAGMLQDRWDSLLKWNESFQNYTDTSLD